MFPITVLLAIRYHGGVDCRHKNLERYMPKITFSSYALFPGNPLYKTIVPNRLLESDQSLHDPNYMNNIHI